MCRSITCIPPLTLLCLHQGVGQPHAELQLPHHVPVMWLYNELSAGGWLLLQGQRGVSSSDAAAWPGSGRAVGSSEQGGRRSSAAHHRAPAAQPNSGEPASSSSSTCCQSRGCCEHPGSGSGHEGSGTLCVQCMVFCVTSAAGRHPQVAGISSQAEL
jgi:hypothetical protein